MAICREFAFTFPEGQLDPRRIRRRREKRGGVSLSLWRHVLAWQVSMRAN